MERSSRYLIAVGVLAVMIGGIALVAPAILDGTGGETGTPSGGPNATGVSTLTSPTPKPTATSMPGTEPPATPTSTSETGKAEFSATPTPETDETSVTGPVTVKYTYRQVNATVVEITAQTTPPDGVKIELPVESRPAVRYVRNTGFEHSKETYRTVGTAGKVSITYRVDVEAMAHGFAGAGWLRLPRVDVRVEGDVEVTHVVRATGDGHVLGDQVVFDTRPTATDRSWKPTRRPTYTFRYVGDGLVTVTVDPDVRYAKTDEGYTFSLPDNATLQSTTDIERRGQTLVWTGKTADPSFTYRINMSGMTNTAVDEGYAVYNYDALRTRDEYAPIDGLPRRPTVNATLQIPGPGINSEGTLVMGNLTVHRRTIDNRTHRVVVPVTVESNPAPPKLLNVMAEAAERLPSGADRGPTTVFIVPNTSWGYHWANGYTVDSRTIVLWPGPSAGVYVMAHEYVHTLQEPPLSERMKWWTEASATYFSFYSTLRSGHGEIDAFQRMYRNGNANGTVLSNPDTWGYNAEYTKGATALAEIDQAIRRETNGTKNLVDVFRRINTATNTVTLEEFLSTIETVGGPESRHVAMTYVTTNRSTPDHINRTEIRRAYGLKPANITYALAAVRIGKGPRQPVDSDAWIQARARVGEPVTLVIKMRNVGGQAGLTHARPWAYVSENHSFHLTPTNTWVDPGEQTNVTVTRRFSRPGVYHVLIDSDWYRIKIME